MPSLRFMVFSLILILALYGLASAQTTRPDATPPGLGRMPQVQRFNAALAKLNLSDDQKKQVDQVKQEFGEQLRDLAPSLKDASPQDKREKLQPLMADFRGKLQDVLTPEQLKQLRTDMQESRQEKADAKPSGRKPLADLKTQNEADADGPMVRRVRDALATVGLSDDQKTKTDAILDDANQQAKKLRDQAAADPAAAREKAGPILRDVAAKLGAVLTDEQKQKLSDQMPRLGKALDGKPVRDKGDKVIGKPGRDEKPSTRPAAAPATQPNATAVLGQPAPAFSLTKLNGVTVTNKTYTGRTLVMVFASLTSPPLRDHVAGLQQLADRNRARASVLLVYTREAHPSDGWQVDRNRDEHFEIAQAQTLADRQAAAKRLRDESKTTLDIAVDGMDDATAAAYAAASDTAVVISPTGVVMGRQRWCDPSGLTRMVEDALKHPTTRPEAVGL